MSIEIETEQWPLAAGCIGLAKLYSEKELPQTVSGVQLNLKVLDSLAEKYIRGLIDNFSVVERDVKRFNWYVEQVKKRPEQTKQYAVEIRKSMNDQCKKVEKYFPETTECVSLKALIEDLKEVKTPEESFKIGNAVERYEEIMKTSFINDKLTLNYAKAVVLNPFFGQTSILQPSFNSKSTEEHIRQIEVDFIQPARLELHFMEILSSAESKEDIVIFLEQNQDYKPFKDLIKPLKKLADKLEVENYLLQETLPCSFSGNLFATQSYEELTFSPLSFSKNKAVNFNWNFDKQLPVPISAVARLVLFIAPFGMTFYSRKIGNGHASETLRFAGLILSQKDFSEVIKENFTYQKLRRDGSSFGEAIVGLIQESVDKAKKINNSMQPYQFLEMYSDYQSKKTLLDYYHMPTYLARYLGKYGKAIDLLLHRDLKDEFFRKVLSGIDPKKVIFDYLRVAIKEPFHAMGAFHATRERKRIIVAKKGDEEMNSYDKTISFVFYRGVDLRNKIVTERQSDQEGMPYKASGRKKLEGIAYRLLNAAKAGNKSAFMDTVFRIHMTADLEVPSIFVESFKEEGLDFETIASAFIAGLLGDEKNKKDQGVGTNG